MKYLLSLVFLAAVSFAHSQGITGNDLKSLYSQLQSENWKAVFKQSAKLLEKAGEDTSDARASVLYIYLYSAAGMVAEEKMTWEEIEQHVMKYEGQRIILAAHPVAASESNTINKTHFSEKDSTYEAFTSAANLKGTNIFCFERCHLDEKPDTSDLDNAMVRCEGTLGKIEVNPRHSMIWVLRLDIVNAVAMREG